jgi:amidase
MDHIGPMTRSVEDAAIMLEVMAGHDPNDPTSLPDPAPRIRARLTQGIAGLRIGFDRRYATENVDEDVARALDEVLEVLANGGARIVEVTMPDVSKVNEAWWEIATAEAAAHHAANYPSRAGEYGEGFRAVLDYGRKVSGVTYANAARHRAEFNGRLDRTLAGVDCLVCPSLSNAARDKVPDPFRAEEDADWVAVVRHDAHTKPFNFSGSPTLSVPCGFSDDGLPLSAQFAGRALSEATLCRVGHAYERATAWHSRHPSFPPPEP